MLNSFFIKADLFSKMLELEFMKCKKVVIIKLLISLTIIVNLLASVCYGNAFGVFTPSGNLLRQPNIHLNIPIYVEAGNVFTLEAVLDEGDYGFAKYVSFEANLPNEFLLISTDTDNIPPKKDKYFLALIKAPTYEVYNKSVGASLHYYTAKSNILSNAPNLIEISNSQPIYVQDKLSYKYNIDPSKVTINYNPDINKAAFVELLPTFLPLGFWIIDGPPSKKEYGREKYREEATIAKIFSTFIGFAAIIPSIDNNGKMNYTATNILALVSYFYITCTYDIPNLYRTYNSNMEMAKIKRELLNK